MNTEKTIKRDKKYVLHTYGRSPIVLERGSGMTVWDADGRAYLDFTSGIGVNSLGFADPDWAAAVAAQAGQLQHTSNLYYTGPCAKLARKLCKRTGLDKVFFANSGAEANEGAIKCARKYSADTYGAGRSKVLSLVNSFHGRTLATLTATGQDVFHHDFGPFPADFGYLPAGDIDALRAALDQGGVCAVMMELVQGEGGVIALDPDYVHRVAGPLRRERRAADRGRGPDRRRPHRHLFGLPALRHHAGHRHAGQGAGRRPAHRCGADEAEGGQMHGPRQPWFHLWRQPGSLRRRLRGGGPDGRRLFG